MTKGAIRSARYGSLIRKNYKRFTEMKDNRYECPSCGEKAVVKAQSRGLWSCKRCDYEVVGDTYKP